MIKKMIMVLVILLLLTGCGDTASLKQEIDTAIENAINHTICEVDDNNCRKEYYSYYLSTGIGKGNSDEVSNIFIINGNKCGLSLDVTTIINNQIYQETKEYEVAEIDLIENPFYCKLGQYRNSSGKDIDYKVSVVETDKKTDFILIQTDEFIFISEVDNGSCSSTIYEMLMILRSCDVNITEVILDHGSKSIITYPTNILTLFDDVTPESGYISDIIGDWKEDTSFIKIDNSDKGNEEIGDIIEDEDMEDEFSDLED